MTRSTNGFTLLEILVSLVILGALMAALAQAIQFGMRAWDTQIKNVARNGDLDTAERILRVLIERMQPSGAPDQANTAATPHSFSFTTELPRVAPVEDTRLASVTLLVTENRLVLRWVEQPHAKLLGAKPPTHEELLLPGVKSVDFSYRDTNGSWSDRWTNPTLPQLVRIHLGFSEALKRRWPDIMVAPRRDGIAEVGG